MNTIVQAAIFVAVGILFAYLSYREGVSICQLVLDKSTSSDMKYERQGEKQLVERTQSSVTDWKERAIMQKVIKSYFKFRSLKGGDKFTPAEAWAWACAIHTPSRTTQ